MYVAFHFEVCVFALQSLPPADSLKPLPVVAVVPPPLSDSDLFSVVLEDTQLPAVSWHHVFFSVLFVPPLVVVFD
jgi:hypothetical protein